MKYVSIILTLIISFHLFSQVTPNINSGNPNFPFPQFKDYNGGNLKTISSSDHHAQGVVHAEMEQTIRVAYQNVCNNMTYNILNNGVVGPTTVNGVKYIMPYTDGIDHCTCVEGDGYYLLAAAYMADKPTFDGYYMWVHDRAFQKTTRFIDNVVNSPNYNYSPGISGGGSYGGGLDVRGGALTGNSAADGDLDVAMALLVAWKQWGDDAVICTDPELGVITYKNEAIRYISTMADTVPYKYPNGSTYLPNGNYVSGIIGLDGYLKNGDSWNEITDWAANASYRGIKRQVTGNQFLYIDYSAPSYFNAFSKVLTQEGAKPWLIEQYDRAEASSDWLMGKMASKGLVGFAGRMKFLSNGEPDFSSYSDGEDFRLGWRTVLNYVWNGNSTKTWNPITHQPVNTPNSYELDFAKNNQKFMNNPQSYGNDPYKLSTLKFNICGPSTMTTFHGPKGAGPESSSDTTYPASATYYRLNKAFGGFSPSTVATQDFNLMAKTYRKCEITWDGANNEVGQQYETSRPLYFHEFFRLLGLMVTTGNWHNPLDMIAKPNLKIYKSVNKTYAYIGDTLTYTLKCRNYGKLDAEDVVITDVLPAGLQYLSSVSSNSSMSFSKTGNSLTWTVNKIKGTNVGLPQNLNLTKDSIIIKVLITNQASSRICNTSTISCSNGESYTSNEYPNNITATMERNCVDIIKDKPLTIKKSASRNVVQVGDTLTYTIVVKNKSVGFLNGGRTGVYFSFGVDGLSTSKNNMKTFGRIFHGADEAYINLSNYRYSYFMNEQIVPNWIVVKEFSEGVGTQDPTFFIQPLTPGVGYNHRLVVRFPSVLSTVTPHLAEYSTSTQMIHRGAMQPPRLLTRFETNPNGNFDFSDDWSADPNFISTDQSDDLLTLITNDWTDPLNTDIPLTKIHPEACDVYTKKSNKILVEEFDGYTWRRIYGTSPVEGRELLNVKVTDSLPSEVVFGGFTNGYPSGTITGNKITWPTITQMLVNDSVVYKFWVTVKDASYFGCPNTPNPEFIINGAKATADNEGIVKDTAVTRVSCDALFTPLKNFNKTSDKQNYQVGDDITYTIGWKNSAGGIEKGVGTSLSSHWQLINGLRFKFNTNSMIISGKDSGGVKYDNLMTNKYSYGNNGSIESTISLISDQEVFALVFRQNGNKWYEIRFKKLYNGISTSLWDFGYTTANTFTQLLPEKLIALTGSTIDINVQLLDQKLSYSIMNPGAIVPSIPQFTYLNLQDVNGYAGWRSNNSSSSEVTAWETNLDAAFNIQMKDPIPSGLTFVSATNANLSLCPSCGSTVISGSNVSGTVTYTNIAGPVMYGDSITYVWKGKVSSCPANGKIINNAVLTINDSSKLTATNIVSCGTVTTPVYFITTNVSKNQNVVVLNWSVSQKSTSGYYYIYKSYDHLNWEIVGNQSPQNTLNYSFDYIENSESTIYYKIVYMGNTENYTSKIVSVSVNNKGLMISPNPFEDVLNIEFDKNLNSILLEIYDVEGKQISSKNYFDTRNITITENLNSGIYILKLITEENTFIHRILRK
ncbi:MAG: T9SS type A sorting domain-containing protein [Cytophagales bacterium]